MQKLLTALFCVLLVFLWSATAWAYNPPPGILGPDEVDFGGQTVRFWDWGATEWHNIRFEPGGVAPGRIEEAEEIFNVNIEFEAVWPVDAYTEEIASRVLSGEATHDWVRVQNIVSFWELVADGMLFNIDTILPDEYYETLHPQDRYSIEMLSFEGDRYCFGHTFGPWSRMVQLVIYNKSLLENEGLPDPYELYEEGQWNWETMTELATAVTADTTGDGETDQFGMSWGVGPNNSAVQLALANEARLTRVTEDGRRVFTFHEPEAIEALEQMNEWYEAGIVGGWFGNGDVAFEFGLWIGGKRGFHAHLDDDVITGLLPLPWGPSSTRDVFPIEAAESHVLPITVQEPEKMLALHSFLWQNDDFIEYNDYFLRGYESPHEAARTQEASDLLYRANRDIRDIGAPMEGVLSSHQFLQGYFAEVLHDVIVGERSPAAAMNEIEPVMQEKLDSLFGT